MQASAWTQEIIAIFVVAAFSFAAIGYLVAALIYGRKATQLASQLEANQQALEESATSVTVLQSDFSNAKSQLHQQELNQSKLQEQLNNAQSTESRLNQELVERKAELQAGRQKQDEIANALHEVEKRYEAAQADIRSLNAQQAEVRERLKAADSATKGAQSEVSKLKDELAAEGKKSKALETSECEAREQLREVKAQLVNAFEKYDDLQRQLSQVNSQYTKLQTEQDEREASHAREVANFEKQKESLTERFKVLSSEIIEAQTKSLQESSKLTLSTVMNPFQQSIDNFKKEVQDIHHRETTQQGELRKELESLKSLNEKITTEAHELSTALRGNRKLQGNWGELVLENVLDRSGLQLGKDYKREVYLKTEDGTRSQRPDAVVYLPQGKHLIIDAKVSLNAYTRYVNAEDEVERTQALKEHVQAVSARINELANRDYYKLSGLNSPEMVFMFIPIESAFVEALKADETLFQKAIENNVLVATPTTLLTSLNIVRQLWRYEDQNKHTAALAKKAETVFKKLSTFLASFEGVKKGLDKAVESYTKAEGQLLNGTGNLVKQVGEFKNLAPAIKAELPSYFAEKAELEIDFIAASESSDTTNSGDIDQL